MAESKAGFLQTERAMAGQDSTHRHGAKPRAQQTPPEPRATDEQDLLQIRDRLKWTPEERLSYLRDMIAFEQLARSARRL